MGGVVECIRKDFSIKNPKTEEDYDERDQRIRMKDLDDDVYGRQSDSNSVYIPRARVDQQRFPDKKIGHYQRYTYVFTPYNRCFFAGIKGFYI